MVISEELLKAIENTNIGALDTVFEEELYMYFPEVMVA